jgi:hypothetical protein
VSSSTAREKNGLDFRVAFAGVLTSVVLVALVALGGLGLASPGKSGAAAAEYQYGKKVTICHKGRTITVSVNALKAHKAHGDTIGPCPRSASAKEKAGGKPKAGQRGGGKPKPGKGSGRGKK